MRWTSTMISEVATLSYKPEGGQKGDITAHSWVSKGAAAREDSREHLNAHQISAKLSCGASAAGSQAQAAEAQH